MRVTCIKSICHFLCIVIVFSHLACQKDEIKKNEDPFIEHAEQLSELKAEVLAAGNEFIEVQWNKIYNTHFKTVSYSVYLDDKKVVEGLNTNKYSLINLDPGKEYSIKIVASTSEGKQTGQVLTASTVPLKVADANSIIYKEYKIHSYSYLTGPTALRRFAEGGHLIVRYLRHPSGFPDGIFKVIVFRTDKEGNLVWYRLLPTLPHGLESMPGISLALHAQEKEGMVFLGGYGFKISASDGTILLDKDFRLIQEPSIQALHYVSPQQLLIGTAKGSLLSLNPNDLSVQWHRTNSSGPGAIAGIKLDSKGFIYAILKRFDEYPGILIHKYNGQGGYLSALTSEGGDAGSVSFLIDATDNFHAFSYSSYSRSLYYSKFNSQGILIKSTTTPDALAAPSPFFNDKNEVVVQGRYEGGGFTIYGGIFVFDQEMNVKSKRFFTEIPYHLLRGVTVNPDGSYNIFLNYMQTYTYSNGNFVFIKTDVNGKI